MALVVDTDIVVYLQRSGCAHHLIALGRRDIEITDEVWAECGRHKHGDGAGDPAARVAIVQALAGISTDILPGTPEAATATALMAQADLDPGEISIIAWAAHHPGAVPVLHDRHAIFRALEELPGRKILSYYGLLRELATMSLAPSVLKTISAHYCGRLMWPKNVRVQPPMWWTY